MNTLPKPFESPRWFGHGSGRRRCRRRLILRLRRLRWVFNLREFVGTKAKLLSYSFDWHVRRRSCFEEEEVGEEE